MLEPANLSPKNVRSLPDSHPLSPLIDAMQESLAAYLRLFEGLPGVALTERDEVGWCIGIPGKEILWTRFDAARCDEQIDAVLGEIGTHCEALDWAVYRTCTPADLGQRLEAKGMKAGVALWMLTDLTHGGEPQAWPDPALRIEIVTRADEMRVWWHVSAAGFENPIEAWKVYHDAYLRVPFGPDQDCVHYIGYLGEEPVTSGTLLLRPGVASLYAISTPPEHRRRGFGGAITLAMLETARQRGYRHACVNSSRMGRSVYWRAGFNVQVLVPEYGWTRDGSSRSGTGLPAATPA